MIRSSVVSVDTHLSCCVQWIVLRQPCATKRRSSSGVLLMLYIKLAARYPSIYRPTAQLVVTRVISNGYTAAANKGRINFVQILNGTPFHSFLSLPISLPFPPSFLSLLSLSFLIPCSCVSLGNVVSFPERFGMDLRLKLNLVHFIFSALKTAVVKLG